MFNTIESISLASCCSSTWLLLSFFQDSLSGTSIIQTQTWPWPTETSSWSEFFRVSTFPHFFTFSSSCEDGRDVRTHLARWSKTRWRKTKIRCRSTSRWTTASWSVALERYRTILWHSVTKCASGNGSLCLSASPLTVTIANGIASLIRQQLWLGVTMIHKYNPSSAEEHHAGEQLHGDRGDLRKHHLWADRSSSEHWQTLQGEHLVQNVQIFNLARLQITDYAKSKMCFTHFLHNIQFLKITQVSFQPWPGQKKMEFIRVRTWFWIVWRKVTVFNSADDNATLSWEGSSSVLGCELSLQLFSISWF